MYSFPYFGYPPHIFSLDESRPLDLGPPLPFLAVTSPVFLSSFEHGLFFLPFFPPPPITLFCHSRILSAAAYRFLQGSPRGCKFVLSCAVTLFSPSYTVHEPYILFRRMRLHTQRSLSRTRSFSRYRRVVPSDLGDRLAKYVGFTLSVKHSLGRRMYPNTLSRKFLCYNPPCTLRPLIALPNPLRDVPYLHGPLG